MTNNNERGWIEGTIHNRKSTTTGYTVRPIAIKNQLKNNTQVGIFKKHIDKKFIVLVCGAF